MKNKILINLRWFAILAFALILACIALLCLVGEDRSFLGLCIFGGISLVAVFVMCISPICYIANSKSIKIQYLFGFYEVFNWTEVRNIYEIGSTSRAVFLMNYRFVGQSSGKKAFFTKGEISANHSTRKIIRTYWRSDFEVFAKRNDKATRTHSEKRKKRRKNKR